MQTYNIRTVAEWCISDKKRWEEFYAQYPAIYNHETETAYVPMGSPVDSRFVTEIVNDTNYSFVTELPETVPRFTIVTDPLIRFCINFRYTDNNIWYNTTGHPRGYFMAGVPATQAVLDSDHWTLRTQSELIEHWRIDYTMSYQDFWNTEVDWERQIAHVWQRIRDSREHWHITYWEKPWEWGQVYNRSLTRHQYLEESTHYNIIKDASLQDQARTKFNSEYQKFAHMFEDPDAFSLRYDQYWLDLEL